MEMLSYLTGKDYSDWDVVMNKDEKNIPAEISYGSLALASAPKKGQGFLFATLGVMGLLAAFGWRQQRRKI
jgi:hypothetical protein